MKTLLTSKTIWGAFVALAGTIAPAILPVFGIDFTAVDGSSVVDEVSRVVAGLGALYAIYGRIVAKKAIEGII